jgi:hypothetical protein
MRSFGRRGHKIESSIDVDAPPESVWLEVTEVDIASFPHPAYLRLLGIPKPMRAEVTQPGLGGRRTAYFATGKRFSQEITAWEPPRHYAFTFHADRGFRVAYLLDISNGPFQMKEGAYTIEPRDAGVRLRLLSHYELKGMMGMLIAAMVRPVMSMFQRYLLRGIKANAERRSLTLKA